MMFLNRVLSSVRDASLELHCLKVRVWQNVGVDLTGHGIIKINQHGVLYLEFICTDCGTLENFIAPAKIPSDGMSEDERLHMECFTLAGDKLTSSGFSIRLSGFGTQPPLKKDIILDFIECSAAIDNNGDYMFFEFSEFSDIPKNKSNSTVSTNGYESHKRNQTDISLEKFEISIVDEGTYKEVRVKGDFDSDRVLSSLRFYIGLTCGSMIQPLTVYQKSGGEEKTRINSISNIQKSQRCSNPIPSSCVIAGALEFEYHYKIFEEMYEIYASDYELFNSLYSQWSRVWHALRSEENVAALSLTVAVEGLLNDYYIPRMKKAGLNNEVREVVEEIKNKLDGLDISEEYRSRLKNSVSYWKNITPAFALRYLVTVGVISQEEKKSWDKLRNKCAHPKTKLLTILEKEQERDELLLCMNLFQGLILHCLKYEGPRNYWSVREGAKTILMEYKSMETSE